ncbi:LOW QUALITY PROTEIN: radial spoke head protein 6 homolog A [Maniola hyperantus]|uniref:LOW QUALITY PROTEIN: radial spoke head protein 6 homolog A n=1 Tax=Aphantopus hyperantus TaxID=2795564 RepID=UPI0015695BB0|nr:LOW QUALITY PROTEIN: radial spoke head protein 6 homolog A [Maniola hyperantus]
MSQTFMLEPDIIAATENVMPDLNNDLVLAKNFLKQQCAATGDTLYDHLVDVVHKILSQKPPDVVDQFEQYSWQVKQEKFRPNFDLLNDIYLSPPQLQLVRRVEEMFQLVSSKSLRLEEMGEEQELDLEEESVKPRIADLIEHNYYFREGGYGLPDSECYALYVALNMLAIKEPVAAVRFFGKIFGTRMNYYVAEADLTIDELDRRIREFEMKDMPGEEEGNEDRDQEVAVEEEKEIAGEGEVKEEKPKEPVPPKLPPIPVSTWQPPPPIPVERPGQGVNKKVYYVCNQPGEPWIGLPDVTPAQIRVARLTVRCMTGDLDAEVLTFPPFEGSERNYLRAQIARIAASTSISPQGFYTFGSGEEEEDIDLEEGAGDLAFNPNPFYQGHTLKDLLDPNLTYWVHHGRYILKQGRTLWWNPNVVMEEDLEEEEEEGPAPIPPESGPSLFTPLSEDVRIEGLNSWSARVSSTLVPDRAIAVLRSNVWPGAVAYSTSGKKSECLYVGLGLKFQPLNFSPVQLPRAQDEYIIGPEVMEMADPTFADEEAYRIAHLPPPPPPELLGEGEGFPLEEEEED